MGSLFAVVSNSSWIPKPCSFEPADLGHLPIQRVLGDLRQLGLRVLQAQEALIFWRREKLQHVVADAL